MLGSGEVGEEALGDDPTQLAVISAEPSFSWGDSSIAKFDWTSFEVSDID